MHPWIARNLIYFPIQAVRGERVARYMREIRAFHDEPLSRQREIQWDKLTRLLRCVYAEHPYYRRLFDEHGIDVGRISTPEDFRRIPLLTKEAVRTLSSEMSSGYSGRVSARKTSGSTGMPLYFVKDRDSTAYMDALMYVLYGWHGISIGDRQARVWGIPLNLKGRLLTSFKDLLLNRKRLVSFDITEESCRNYFSALRRFKPVFMYGLVNTILEFARVSAGMGMYLKDLKMKAVITTGEILFPRSRDLLTRFLRCSIVNEYGTTENGIVAFECPFGTMHLLMHNIYVEVLNRDSGQPVAPGESGEVVLTELHSRATPFIRYRVGDMIRLSAGECECGLELPVVDEVLGRESDLIVTPDARKVSSAVLSYSMTDGVLRFRSYQRAIDRLDVYVETTSASGAEDLHIIEKNIRTYVGDIMKVTVAETDHLEPERSGKFRHFVSELNQEDIR